MYLSFGEMFINISVEMLDPSDTDQNSVVLHKSGPNLWILEVQTFCLCIQKLSWCGPNLVYKTYFQFCNLMFPLLKPTAHCSPHIGNIFLYLERPSPTSSISLYQNPTHSSKFNSKSISYIKCCKIFFHPNMQLGVTSWDSKPPEMSDELSLWALGHTTWLQILAPILAGRMILWKLLNYQLSSFLNDMIKL